MTIATKKGDAGISYWQNKAVGKEEILIEANGCLDEVQAAITMINCELRNTALDAVANDLWGVMGEIAYETKYLPLGERLKKIEEEIIEGETNLPKLDKFLIFKKEKATKINWVRTLVRKAERRLVALSKKQNVNPLILAYTNRLSDYLFIKAREAENG